MLTAQQVSEVAEAAAAAVVGRGDDWRIQSTFVDDIEWARAALEDQSPLLLFTGSAGGAKSRTGLEKLHRYLQQYPGATGLMMRKAREWAEKSIAPFMKHAVIGNSGIAVHKKADKLFQYANGSTLYYGGMKDDDQRESIRSIGKDGALDIALFEEANAFVEDDFNEIIGRMRGRTGDYRQIIFLTNPDAPNHWINRRLILGGEAKVYYSSAKDNPHNAPEYIENLNKMTGILYKRLVLGQWVQAEGVIYDNFSLEGNVSTDAEYNPEWTVRWGVDDGYVRGSGPGTESYHPRVVLFANITPQGFVHVFDEYYATGELSEVTIQNCLDKPYRRPEIAFIDSSAAELKARLAGSGIQMLGATHRVGEGIKNARRFMCDPNGVRLLKIHPRCVNFIRELQSYAYDPDSNASMVGERKPNKVDDHGPDALRYLLFNMRYR